LRRLAIVTACGCRTLLGIDDPAAKPDAATCSIDPLYGPDISSQRAVDTRGTKETFVLQGLVDAATSVELVLTLVAPSHDFPAIPIGPTACIDLSETRELDLATCGSCLLLVKLDAAGNAIDYYQADDGSLDIAETTPNLSGDLTGATFSHVSVDPTGSTRIDDGCVSAIAALGFSAPVTMGNAR
jgi:hypothetical protein